MSWIFIIQHRINLHSSRHSKAFVCLLQKELGSALQMPGDCAEKAMKRVAEPENVLMQQHP